MPTRITLTRCAKTFANGTRALEPIDLVVEPGECLVLLGPSGCGKTTLLRMIAGLAEPDAGGIIRFGDEDVTARPIEVRKVGMVFQSYALFPNMNVAQNVGYGLKIRGDQRVAIDRRVAELLALVQLREYGSRRVDELSGGQKQRVALARAVAIEPSVLLLDEPLTALDAKLRESLRIELKRLLRALGVTSVFVTHDQAEAMAIGDRIAVLSKGRIEQIGSAEDIYCRPATRFVAEFIGQVNAVRLDGHGEVLVRPEHVRVVTAQRSGATASDSGHVPLASGVPEAVGVPGSDGVSSTNAVPRSNGSPRCLGTVQLATFLGNLVQLEVALADGQVVLVEAPARELPSDLLRAGTQVTLEFDTQSFIRPSS